MCQMPQKRSTPIILSYVSSLFVTIILLVVWVVSITRLGTRINELAARLGVPNRDVHWVVMAVGCGLFFVLLIGLTYQLAQTFAERRYSRKQEEFISNITHEMKSPLAAIKLHAQTLQQPDVQPAEVDRCVGFILQQTERMSRLVDNVLESSRLLARKERMELQPVALAPFFDSYFDEVRARIEKQGIHLRVEGETAAVVMATTDALHRVLDNLLDNAVRFSDRGGEVRCRVRDGEGWVRIAIEDDGVGIPKGELHRIFDRFYQIGREISDRRRGTGLGLSIVSDLVRHMNGSISAFSQDGKAGSRFVVELPMTDRSETAGSASPKIAAATTAELALAQEAS